MYLFHLPKDPEEVEPDELLEFLDGPGAGGVEPGDELHVLGNVLQSGGHTEIQLKGTFNRKLKL